MRGSTRQLSDLVDQARRYGVRDEAVLEAIGRVPRQQFVPRRFVSAAYDDGPLPIGEGQTISQPAMVAMMAEAARLNPHDCVLEVGAGSGYGALVLRALAGRVVTIERRLALAEKARAALAGHGLGDVTVVVGDGTLGWPEEATYDAIVVTAAGPVPPPPLLEQLAPGGRLVIPIGPRYGHQHLMRYTRRGQEDPDSPDGGGNGSPGEEYREERLTPVRFVPLIGTHGFPGRK
ncbi:MAG: protein-L-isoaspartate(D-aspartate) O-methyltransferase [Acidimicrobiaceae bacterium]|nr:protein-L-isoaspartate(D-aspartate) O-methyltransferase [Acidimicrobiaceae bacterium]MYE97388.1 protein-L-isoaspartate(D-aspartate) O-methyltransferase [Acidimicrobiaceae bacterium]MYI53438.1 protein-L-isoaspartate(D-aspartate) O-methyltransferase [Acidimicrobiaceae bacterium]